MASCCSAWGGRRTTASNSSGAAADLDHASAQSLDPSEEIEVSFIAQAAISGDIEAGRFSQALHVASFYRAVGHLAARCEP
ncbi:hypothetical protein [Roseateles sp. P5_E1]